MEITKEGLQAKGTLCVCVCVRERERERENAFVHKMVTKS